MATVYEVEIVSHWINYPEDELEKMLNEAIKEKERKKGNVVSIRIKKRR